MIHPFFHGGLISLGMHSAALDESAAQDQNLGNRTLEASDKNEGMISATGIGKKIESGERFPVFQLRETM